MNLIYFGSPDFSATILNSLLHVKDVRVVAVVTNPDQPTGRNQQLTPSPVSTLANQQQIPLFKPAKLDPNHLSHLKLLKPDIFLVVAYGKIVPEDWLATPSLGTFNLHFSLLPKYRGALCISESIKNQDAVTGVTLMKMDNQLDHGPIIYQSETVIDIDDDCATLTTKLAQTAIDLLHRYLSTITSGKYSSRDQDNTQATYTPTTKTRNHQSAFIPFSQIQTAILGTNALQLHALIRSLSPDPGAWTTINQQPIKILKTHLDNNRLVLDMVQISGKKAISWPQYLTGHPLN